MSRLSDFILLHKHIQYIGITANILLKQLPIMSSKFAQQKENCRMKV